MKFRSFEVFDFCASIGRYPSLKHTMKSKTIVWLLYETESGSININIISPNLKLIIFVMNLGCRPNITYTNSIEYITIINPHVTRHILLTQKTN